MASGTQPEIELEQQLRPNVDIFRQYLETTSATLILVPVHVLSFPAPRCVLAIRDFGTFFAVGFLTQVFDPKSATPLNS